MKGAWSMVPFCFMHAVRSKIISTLGEKISNELDAKVNLVGLDGEKSTSRGSKESERFSDSNTLTCMKHSRENCVQKLSQLGVGKQDVKKDHRRNYG